jgi:excisionase family DNA binding protein
MPGWPSNRPPAIGRKRRYNVRSIKATLPYTVQEVAKLLGIHKHAVLRWLKGGLYADRSQRPFLIRGDELARFLNERHSSNVDGAGPTSSSVSNATHRAKLISPWWTS